jgi:uncharacterized protein (DUF433 family)
MDLTDGIIADPHVRFGRPVFRGTRVPVDLVLGKLGGGMTYEEVCAEYDLTREHILAALNYAAQTLEKEQLHVATT